MTPSRLRQPTDFRRTAKKTKAPQTPVRVAGPSRTALPRSLLTTTPNYVMALEGTRGDREMGSEPDLSRSRPGWRSDVVGTAEEITGGRSQGDTEGVGVRSGSPQKTRLR